MLLKAINSIKEKLSLNIVMIGEGKNKKSLENYAKKIGFKDNLYILNLKKSLSISFKLRFKSSHL